MGTATSTATAPVTHEQEMSFWQRWLRHPETLPVHRVLFQVHLWLGMLAAMYVTVMSLSGSMIVFRDRLESSAAPNSTRFRAIEWVVNFHENLLSGDLGRRLNGVGAIAFLLICVTGAVLWWPGIAHWRRSLTINWRSSLARVNWDLHNTLGAWAFLFLAIWGLSGIYFAFPELSYPLVDADPSNTSKFIRFAGAALLWFTNLHFGRFSWATETLWTIIGLVPVVLVFTGIFMCCHRIFIRKGAPLPR
jgi:uncharacterized iron-regulated membrane protein